LISDELLRRAAAVSNELFLEYILQDYEREHAFSPAFEQKIKKLYLRAKHPYLYRAMHRAISILLAVLISGSIWLTFDTQARAAFFGWVRETYETFFVYRFSAPTHPTASPKTYQLTWLPDGYSELFSTDTEFGHSALYENEQGQFLQFEYVYAPESATFYVDMENTVKQSAVVGNARADLLLSTNNTVSSVIMWTNQDNTAFYISAFCNAEELIRLAESVSNLSF